MRVDFIYVEFNYNVFLYMGKFVTLYAMLYRWFEKKRGFNVYKALIW